MNNDNAQPLILGPDTDWPALADLDVEVIPLARFDAYSVKHALQVGTNIVDGTRRAYILERGADWVKVRWHSDNALIPCSVAWCIGHEGNEADSWADLTHRESAVSLTDFPDMEGERQTREAWTQHELNPDRGDVDYLVLHVEGTFASDELQQLANALDEAAIVVRERAQFLKAGPQ